MNANVWAISESKLFEKGKWQGFIKNRNKYFLDLFRKHGKFLTRGPLENNPAYKQIIGQVILRVGNKFLLHRINDGTSEERLKNLWPLLLGGHVEEIDVQPGKDIIEAAIEREFKEEVVYEGKILSRKCLGLLYVEDEHPVNAVHVGLVYEFVGDSEKIRSAEDVIGELHFVTIDELKKFMNNLTYWSRLLVPVLEKRLLL